MWFFVIRAVLLLLKLVHLKKLKIQSYILSLALTVLKSNRQFDILYIKSIQNKKLSEDFYWKIGFWNLFQLDIYKVLFFDIPIFSTALALNTLPIELLRGIIKITRGIIAISCHLRGFIAAKTCALIKKQKFNAIYHSFL